MAVIDELVVKIGADLKEFSKGMDTVTGKLNDAGESMKSFGSKLSLGVTAPLVAFGAKAVQAFDQQQKALAQVEAGLISTGGKVGFTLDELAKKASALQENSLFGDEEILQGLTANLLTFTNITGEAFERTQQAAIDLSARLGTDLQSSAIQLGKALNDPVANLSALSRAGIQFSEDQKAVIKSMVEANDLAGAQSVILDELETQFGGAGAAAARAGLGPFQQLGMAIGDLTEDFGEVIADAILPFADALKGAVQFVKDLDEDQKKLIITIAGIAAAIGPLAFGFGLLLTAISPVSLAIAGVVAAGALLMIHWDDIKEGFLRLKVFLLGAVADMLQSIADFTSFIPGMGDAVQSAADSVRLSMGNAALALSEFKIEQGKTRAAVVNDNAIIAAQLDTTASSVVAANKKMSQSFTDITGTVQFATKEQADAYKDLQEVHRSELHKTSVSLEESLLDISDDFKELDKIAEEELESLLDSMKPLHVEDGPLDRIDKKFDLLGKDAKNSLQKITDAFGGRAEGGLLGAIDKAGAGISGLINLFGGGGGLGGILGSLAGTAFPGLGVAMGAIGPIMDKLGVDVGAVMSGISNAVSGVANAIGGLFGIGGKAKERANEFKAFADQFAALGIDPSGELSSQDEASIRALLSGFQNRGIVGADELLATLGLSASDITLDLGDLLENIFNAANLAAISSDPIFQAASILDQIMRGEGALFDAAQQFGADPFEVFNQLLDQLGVTRAEAEARRALFGMGGGVSVDPDGELIGDLGKPGDVGRIGDILGGASVDVGGSLAGLGSGGTGSIGGASRGDQTINVQIDGRIIATTVLPHMEREINLRVQ